jgi:hypothetical protein
MNHILPRTLTEDAMPLTGHFRCLLGGSWDNMHWQKDDVGENSTFFVDRHNFKAIYIRFKGEKTPRVIPEIVFRRYFEPIDQSKINPKKWANADKGGTDIVATKRDKEQLSKNDIERELDKALPAADATKAKLQSKKKAVVAKESHIPLLVKKLIESRLENGKK